MRVVVAGGTGFVGASLVRALAERGDSVCVLTRNPDAARPRLPARADAAPWENADFVVAFADAVVNLSGEQAVGRRWTRAYKNEILQSRVGTTKRLVAAMRATWGPESQGPTGSGVRPEPGSPARVFVCASGVGYYGPRGGEPIDESGPRGSDFLAEVCGEWEAAAGEAEAIETPAGPVRVVRARLGIVLGKKGGALAQMVLPFRLFAGGPIGSGEQVVSWIHEDDAVAILLRALDDRTLSGAINVTTPSAVTSRELATAIGKCLSRPSVFPVPAFALRARFGEGADPLLTGQRAIPAVLQRLGHRWQHEDIEGALRASLPS